MSPFGAYKDFAACVLANKNKKSPEGYCASLHKKITGRWPGQSESYTDPLVIDQPKGTKLKFSLTQSISNPLSEQERKSILYDIIQCQRQNKPDVFKDLWTYLGLEYADSLPESVEDTNDLSVYLSETSPDLSSIDLSKVILRCSTDLNLYINLSESSSIHWTIPQGLSSVQYLESGDIKSPVRNKIICNKIGDIIKTEYGEITTNAPSQSVIAEGEAALGISTNDLHEYFFWFNTEGLNHLSGRWIMKMLDEDWVINHTSIITSPLLLTIPDIQQTVDECGITCIAFSPELLPILESDDLGKVWLQGFVPEFISSTYNRHTIVQPEIPDLTNMSSCIINCVIYNTKYNSENNTIELYNADRS